MKPKKKRGVSRRLLMRWIDKHRRNATLAERVFRSRLDEYGIPYSFQHLVGYFIADFYLPSTLLVVEIDDPDHLTTRGRARDAARTRAILYYCPDAVRDVVRFTNDQVLDGAPEVLEFLRTQVPQQYKPALRVPRSSILELG